MADRVAADKGQSSRDQERSSEVGQDATSSVPGVPDSEVEGRKRKGRNNKRLRGTRDTSPNIERPRTFTCPFYVYDPKGYARCWLFSPRSLADVRQHIRRTHMQPFHCPTCNRVFVRQGDRDRHINQRTCIRRDIKIPGITENQSQQIKDSQNGSGSEMEKWFTLWGIIFPDAVPPDSSYIKAPMFMDPVQQLFDQQFKEGPLPRAPATSEASIGEIHPARPNTSPWDDVDDMSSDEDRYARSFIFSASVSASSDTSRSSSGHAKPAREILADLLTNDDELRALLAAGAADTNIGIERLSKNFRTLLKIYSEELLELADTTALKEAGKLVRNSSLYVSNRIRTQFGQPSQSSPLEDPGRLMNEEERSAKEERLNQYLKSLNAADQIALGDALPGAGIEDTDEDWHDEEAITNALEQVKSFLRNGPPFENLRQRLKSFVTPASGAGDQPMDKGMVKIQASADGFTQTLPILIDSLLEHLVDLLPESPVHEGKVRARWTCRCGVRLFDDFTELELGSVKDLENHLRELNSGTQGTQQLARTVFESMKDLSIRVQSVFRRMRRATRIQGTTLPLQNVVSQSAGTGPQGQKSLHILFCIEKENLGTRLHQACVENINTDRETFDLLRKEYQARRNTTSWLTLRSIKKLSLSRFLIDSSNLADVHWHLDICRAGCVCLPPLPLVLEKKYACCPAPEVPQKHEPAIGPNRLRHCFLNPECLNLNQQSIYNQLPKRVGKPLSVSHLEEELGWGVHFEEGWHHMTIYLIAVILLVFSSLVFGITWAVTKGDIQGAFAISCFLTSLGGILVGYLAIKSQ